MATPELMLPIRRDLTGEDAITQGAYWHRGFALAFADGSLWDTGLYSGRMQVRASYSSAVAVELTDVNYRLFLGIRGVAPNLTNLVMALEASVTAPLADWGLGVYDVEFTDTTGRTIRVYEGLCTMSREVTR